jgi:hypothetical protein
MHGFLKDPVVLILLVAHNEHKKLMFEHECRSVPMGCMQSSCLALPSLFQGGKT